MAAQVIDLISLPSSPLSDVSASSRSSQKILFSTAPKRCPPPPHHRAAKELPYDLREQVVIKFEESLYSSALTLLLNLLTPGLALGNNAPPACVPPPSHLALISTLVVHPSLNTRAKATDRIYASNIAAQYLDLVQKTVGPLNARFADAYAFPKGFSDSRRSTHGRRPTGSPDVDKPAGDDIQCDLAMKDSVWMMGSDFWAVVGWAFNCSVRHKKRWERWQLWLEHLVSLLKSDWEARNERDKEASLVVRYVAAGGGDRRIVRAIFADGTDTSVAEFGEIWKNETKERERKKERLIKKIELDIEEGNYGDYLQESSDSEDLAGGNGDDPGGDKMQLDDQAFATTPNSLPDGTILLGGQQALSLRLRLLSLLSTLSSSIPTFFTPLSSLYDLYLTHVRPMPLPTFSAILSPPFLLESFSPDEASSLVQFLAHSLLETAAPTPSLDELTQEMMIRCYLQWAANTMGTADNAKVGICMEVLLGMFDRIVGLRWDKKLDLAAREGIRRREEKARRGFGKRRKGEAGGDREGAEGEIDKALLLACGQRIKMMVAMASRD